MRRFGPANVEQLVGALIPARSSRPALPVAPLPVLAVRRLPTDPTALPLVALARLDRSGRLSARAVLTRLGWVAGHRVDVEVVDGALLVASRPDGAPLVGCRGGLALPAAARTLCAITVTEPVVVAAYPSDDLMVIHPVAVVARLLRQLHTSVAGDGG